MAAALARRRGTESEFTRYKELVRGTPEMELRGQVKDAHLRVKELDERLRRSEASFCRRPPPDAALPRLRAWTALPEDLNARTLPAI